MKTKTLTSLLISTLAIGFFCSPANAQSTKEQLRQRAEQRYPALREMKAQGIVGEKDDGFVGIVDGKDASADARTVVDAENTDRRELYAILAKEGNSTPAAVARQAAKRNFDRASAGEWLSTDGKWAQKK